jgi:hypothetical protein
MSTAMLVPTPTPGPGPVTVTGTVVHLDGLALTHGEAAGILRSCLTEHGPDATADLVRRALPVGLLAVTLGAVAVDTGAIQRTLDALAGQVDTRSAAALAGLDQVVARLRADQESVATAARDALSSLPDKLDGVLAAESISVRQAVTDAARSVQAAGLQQMQAALTAHAAAVRDAVSLDTTDGPIQALRRDVLAQVADSRRELGTQLAGVRELLAAADAARTAGRASSRKIGADWEESALAIACEVITNAGDRFEAVGSTAAPGGTARTGDAVATLGAAVTGRSRTLRIVLEAKTRTRPLTATQWRSELTTARQTRDAVAALALVPSCDQVPGGGSLARVDDTSFVVAATDEHAVQLVFLVLRELVALHHVRQDDTEVDLGRLETHLEAALAALTDFDDVGRLATQAGQTLERLKTTGARARARITESITAGLALIHD